MRSASAGGDLMGHTPFGYRIVNGSAVIEDSEAQCIRQMFRNYLDGMSLSDTAKSAGLCFTHSHVKRLLMRSCYCGDDFYPAAAQAFENFFVRHPFYERNNEVELWYGDLHRGNKNYLAAIAQYKKADALYPNSPYKAASLRLIGDIYADNLKNTAAATEAYTTVLRLYPNSSETGIVYKHMAILDENNKQYDSALINYDKAIELLGDSSAVYEAYRGKADVYTKTNQHENAYNVLHRAAELSNISKEQAADALAEAAKIAHKKLKDETKYVQSLDKAVLLAPNDPKTAQRMCEIGDSYTKQGKLTKAQEVYKKLILQFPTSKYASSAQGKLTRLQNTK